MERLVMAGAMLAGLCLAAGSARPATESQAGARTWAPVSVPVAVPAAELADQTWGIACLSVASGREAPEHKAELGTQVLMGEVVEVLGRTGSGAWYRVRTGDGYECWLEKGTFVRGMLAEMGAWTNSARLIVTALEGVVLSGPEEAAEPVSDLVVANVVKKLGEGGDWYRVGLPDGREGWVRKAAVMDYGEWRAARRPTAANIERTARGMMGRPYLWGGNSPKGMDCSGFTKLVFLLNGVELRRNASQQARQGEAVRLDAGFSELRTGDLLFFGRRGVNGEGDRITHVGIYLREKLFIHASERVQINSLDPGSSLRDQQRINRLLFARRVLPGEAVAHGGGER